jgi:hypothetical protein
LADFGQAKSIVSFRWLAVSTTATTIGTETQHRERAQDVGAARQAIEQDVDDHSDPHFRDQRTPPESENRRGASDVSDL